MSNEGSKPWVIIVGAGPAGLVLALLLGQKGVPVRVVDLAHELDSRPRATHYSAPANYELRRAGLMDEILRKGFVPDGVSWRKLDGTYLSGMSNLSMDADDRMVCLPLDQLGKIILHELVKQPTVQISWGHKVVGVGQDNEEAWVDVEVEPGNPKLQLKAKYVVGCDGANSQVRKCLFGKNFPGFTWDEQIVATNAYYPFEKHGYGDANFIIHPEHWYMAARITNDGMWRVTYGEEAGLTNEELIARQPMKFQKILPGHEKPEENAWKLISISPYKVHQRLVEKMRVGRICLAADAAHLCNPFGGMGLTGGMVDAGNLADCLLGLYGNKTDDTILDRYDQVRRQKYNDIINPISSANIRRLFDQDPDTALDSDPFLQVLQKASSNIDFSRKMQAEVKSLMYDFTQYFN